MQFVVINTTQKKVDPALVLRILHKRYRDKSEKLEFFLRGQSWRLWGIEMCDELNADPNSPWCDKIISPGDDRKGRVLSEQNFVNSFGMIYSRIDDQNIVKDYVPLYWRAIANLWPEGTGDNAYRYSLQRTSGINSFHYMFPFIYFKSVSLGTAKIKDFTNNLKPVRKKYKPDFWARGGEAKNFTSLTSQRTLADRMINSTLLGGKGLKLAKLPNSLLGTKEGSTWDIAARLIPMRTYFLFKQEKLLSIDSGATGVYIFIFIY